MLVVHGTSDGVLPINNGWDSQKTLAALPVDLLYREYPMGHEVSRESLADVTSWLSGRLDDAGNMGKRDTNVRSNR